MRFNAYGDVSLLHDLSLCDATAVNNTEEVWCDIDSFLSFEFHESKINSELGFSAQRLQRHIIIDVVYEVH
jgi:hypothetical protein